MKNETLEKLKEHDNIKCEGKIYRSSLTWNLSSPFHVLTAEQQTIK